MVFRSYRPYTSFLVSVHEFHAKKYVTMYVFADVFLYEARRYKRLMQQGGVVSRKLPAAQSLPRPTVHPLSKIYSLKKLSESKKNRALYMENNEWFACADYTELQPPR